MKKVWLDTDIGSDIDDALCLTYLLCEKDCDLLGISTVSGESKKRAELSSAILRHAGREVPVYSGTNEPLVIPTVQKEAPQYKKIDAFPHRTDFKENTAVLAMRDAIYAHPHEITLLTIGPLTNVALLFAMDPKIPSLLKEMVLMGGHFVDPIDGIFRQEWNIFCDPHAAHIVANAAVARMVWIGLDVTTKVVFDQKEAVKKLNSPVLEPTMAFSSEWFSYCGEMTFHDPLAAAVMFDENLCTFVRGNVEVVYQEGPTCGRTLFTPDEKGRHLIADGVKPELFFERYLRVTGCHTGGQEA